MAIRPLFDIAHLPKVGGQGKSFHSYNKIKQLITCAKTQLKL